MPTNNLKKGIFCFAFPAWNGDYTKSTVELMKAAAASVPVLYTDYAYTWKDVLIGLLGRHPHIPLGRVLGWQNRLRTTESGVQLWSLPPLIPINQLPPGKLWQLLWKVNCWFIRRSLQRAAARWGREHFVCINAFQPLYNEALRAAFPTHPRYYYCYDEIEATHYTMSHAAQQEPDAIATATGLLCTSSGLLSKKRQPGIPATCIHNGVDAFFLRAERNSKSATRPRIGYVGAVDHRLDRALLQQAITTLRAVDFIFVGRISDAETETMLRKQPNVQLLGAMEYHHLPAVLATFDVGIIPFLRTPFTACIYPMKVNEYLAVGLPVVSTNFGDMSEFRQLVSLADEATAFTEALQGALTDKAPAAVAARKAFAREQTWDGRARQLLDFLGIQPNRAVQKPIKTVKNRA